MAAANVKKEVSETNIEESAANKKCFIIMPIADHPNYEQGHFKRVYDHLITPACALCGYEAVRADDNYSSNMIMHDILLKIIQYDMVICDLSTNNANVFYELGLRQAFNKKTVLITDGREKTPFDLLGFRYQQYSSSLRVDDVSNDINKISNALKATESSQPNEINSIVKLLEIDSAQLDTNTPVEGQAVSMQMFNILSAQIANISKSLDSGFGPSRYYASRLKKDSSLTVEAMNDEFTSGASFATLEAYDPTSLDKYVFRLDSVTLGKFQRYSKDNSDIIFTGEKGETTHVVNSVNLKKQIRGYVI